MISCNTFSTKKPLQNTIQYKCNKWQKDDGWNLGLPSDLRCFKLQWPPGQVLKSFASVHLSLILQRQLPRCRPKSIPQQIGHCKQRPTTPPALVILKQSLHKHSIQEEKFSVFSVKVLILNQLPLPLLLTCLHVASSHQSAELPEQTPGLQQGHGYSRIKYHCPRIQRSMRPTTEQLHGLT